MNQLEQLKTLNALLLAELPQYKQEAHRFPDTVEAQRSLLRALFNLRPPMEADREFLRLQDAYLSARAAEKGVVNAAALPSARSDERLALWQGDITRLRADAIVNAANSGMTGCYHPNHSCIDNCIHTFAGVQLRLACQRLMDAQGHEERTGLAKMTPGFNLPSRYILHTVGPIVEGGRLTDEHRRLLACCYRSCLELAARHQLQTIVFPCISTGVFGFPQLPAAEIAIETVQRFLSHNTSIGKVIFNVFKDSDLRIYQDLLEGC